MAGHSKWANIKRRKGAQDVARGKLFTKLIKEIMVAARIGGGDVDANPRLRLAVDKARANSMPKANVERAIAKATGEADDANYENITYEGYGPGGVAILVECLTDNRNRTASDVRHAFSKGNGSLGTSGSVAYLFTRTGQFTLPGDLDEDAVIMAALEGGGDDIENSDGEWIVTCAFEQYFECGKALEGLDVEVKAEITQIPDVMVPVSMDDAGSLLALLERIDDLDDVQDTYTNADLPDDFEG